MKKIAVLAITKNGIEMSLKLKEHFSNFEVFAPIKFSNDDEKINWYDDYQDKNGRNKYWKINIKDATTCH